MLIPTRSTIFDAVHRHIVAGIRDSPQKASGLVWGRLVADSLVAARANDGSDADYARDQRTRQLEANTADICSVQVLPQWGFVTPFALPNIIDVRPPGPPTLDSD